MTRVTLEQLLPAPKSKLTEKAVAEIRAFYAQGAAKSRLAKAYGVSRQTIMAIVNNETWRRPDQPEGQ